MMNYRNTYILLIVLALFAVGFSADAQGVDTSTIDPSSRVEIFFSPRSGSFMESATFEIPVLINTNGKSVRGIELRLNFDKDKLVIIDPSSGRSIMGTWVESPRFDNIKGIASYIGLIPDGITTESGLIVNLTFKALVAGLAVVKVDANSSVLLDDDLGTRAVLDLGRAEYTILQKKADGIRVFSETHPSQSKWYNNNNPLISWENNISADGFSFEIDNKPFTIPDNEIDSKETTKAYEGQSDGLWYFHIKANKNGVWGTTTHFQARIDTVPPLKFEPTINNLLAASILVKRTLVSFSATDQLSGISHYEVGVIDKSRPITESPAFIESESPFQVPFKDGSNLRVIVRAIDKAGNTRDTSIDVRQSLITSVLTSNYLTYIVLLVVLVGPAGFILYRRKHPLLLKDTKPL